MDHRVSKIVATNFILRRSGTYQRQFNRNFTASANMGAINKLADSIEAGGMTTITPALIANSGANLLTLSAGITNPAGIQLPGNWNDKRGIFILALEITFTTGGITNYYIQGFTDHDGFTAVNVDPNMRLYINNVITAIPATIKSGGVQHNTLRLASTFQTMHDFGAIGGNGLNDTRLLRPQDVFGQMKNQEFQVRDILVTDPSSVIGGKLMSSRRRNNNPLSYASAILNGYVAARLENDQGEYTTGAVAEQAFGVVLEKDGIEDFFLRKIRESSGNARAQSHFTYSELQRVVPNVDMIKNVIGSAGVGVQLSQAGDSEHFAGQTLSTVTAVELATVIPSIMLECMLSTVVFTVTNMVSGVLDMVPQHVACFANDLTQQQFMVFQSRCMNEVFNRITDRGRLNFNATISCSFHSEIVITIRIGDDPETRFVAPAFCDSLFSPVVTTDVRQLSMLSSDMSVMCDHISDSVITASLQKDRVISRSLSGAPSGALAAAGGNAFTIPKPVAPMSPFQGGMLPQSNSGMGTVAAPVAHQPAPTFINTGNFNTSGSSATRM